MVRKTKGALDVITKGVHNKRQSVITHLYKFSGLPYLEVSMQTWSPGQPRRDGESCRLRCPMAREVSPCPCWSHCSSWPEFLKLFVCYRGKKNLLQIQCLFISQAASLPAEAGPFWMGPTVGIGSWDIQHPSRCPWLELPSPHGGPSLPTPH